MKGIKYTHCKGCGICSRQCPKDAITMVEEGEE
jgi:pyruvate ferredoxin oxidoreductase delta subunit